MYSCVRAPGARTCLHSSSFRANRTASLRQQDQSLSSKLLTAGILEDYSVRYRASGQAKRGDPP